MGKGHSGDPKVLSHTQEKSFGLGSEDVCCGGGGGAYGPCQNCKDLTQYNVAAF
jgi:hypothetical protein